jgi:hypothetical protein
VAKIFPSDWKSLDARGVMGRQIETLRLLEGALGARYSVYHGVHWTRIAESGSVFDGIDFVVVSPAGRIVLIEQQVGLLAESGEGLVKLRADHRRSVPVMLGRAAASLSERLAAAFGIGTFAIDELLYCPDYTVRDPSIAGVPANRIVDATRRDRFVSILRELAPVDEAVMPAYARLHRFFCDLLDLAPDTAALRERRAEWVTRLAEGLATWGLALEMTPHRVRVIGTAGSGKTQLAMRVIERASKAGQRSLYVCFNRPLADHIATIAPADARILTYHQLCDEQLQKVEKRTDFTARQAFRDLERRFAELDAAPPDPVDVLIVDEGQDFATSWVAPLLRQVKPEGAVWWLEDPMQNLYQREAVALPGFVTLRAKSNYRSPRDIVALLHALLGDSAWFEAASPFESADVVLASYANDTELKEETKRAITQALQAGFARADIALVSFHGRESSHLVGLDALGPHRLRGFTGSYDLLGNPVFSEGEVLFESLYRFKGQAAPCVILTEVDFEEIDEKVANKLFVAATRASMQLMIVASTAAASCLIKRAPGLVRREAATAMASK